MKTLVLLVGNIASGKSTLAKKWVDNGYRVISRDAVRYMVGAGNYTFDPDLEPTIKKGTLALMQEFLKDDIDIMCDEVNVSKRLRKPTIELAKQYGYTIVAVVMPRLEQAISVNRRLNAPHGKADSSIWEIVWSNFDEMYEEPTIDEGITNIIRIPI